MYHMKILIPSITAGAIIGKGGDTIAQLQTATNTKIKMSKTNDFYPGKWSFRPAIKNRFSGGRDKRIFQILID